jgi:hypothetical protein
MNKKIKGQANKQKIEERNKETNKQTKYKITVFFVTISNQRKT